MAVGACALNFADSLLCGGSYQERPALPFSPGLEVAGVVSSTGPDVSGVDVGDRVVGLTALPHGGLADTALTHAGATFVLPPHLDDAHGAAMLVTYQTAWVGLHRRVGLRPSDVVVVHGAAGGTGSAFVQLAAAAGALVIATAGGPAKVARPASSGPRSASTTGRPTSSRRSATPPAVAVPTSSSTPSAATSSTPPPAASRGRVASSWSASPVDASPRPGRTTSW